MDPNQYIDNQAKTINFSMHTLFVSKIILILERGTCCRNQIGIYKKFGQDVGLCPNTYFNKVLSFSSQNDVLNLVKVRRQATNGFCF